MTHVLEVESIDKIGHMLSSPIGQLSSSNVLVSFGSKVLLCI